MNCVYKLQRSSFNKRNSLINFKLISALKRDFLQSKLETGKKGNMLQVILNKLYFNRISIYRLHKKVN